MSRLFFALPILPSILQPVVHHLKQRNDLPAIRWSPPENWHLTLRFLGEVPSEKINSCIAQVETALQSLTSFEFSLGGLIPFPTNHPRLLVVQVSLSIALNKLHQLIEEAMTTIGFKADPQAFFPHITLGKFQQLFSAAHFMALKKEEIFIPPNQLATNVVLFESQLTPAGSIYQATHEFHLA
jgi:2'-5' RNA ligase